MSATTEPRPGATGFIVLHILAGPLIVDLTIVLLPLSGAVLNGDFNFQMPQAEAGEIALVYGGLFVFSFVLGLVPAVLHAVTMILLHRFLGSSLIWLALTPVVGWLSTMVLILLFSSFTPHAIAEAAPMALLGSVAAMGCMAIAWVRRMPPARGKLPA
ncbi:MAG: hypothetical protein GX970_02350 [Phyllobacteriaceae bacterium]|nr:hypothetical protein [Phyllobacteriaceae bacterium]